MSTAAVVLIVCSAFMHACWNLLVDRSSSTTLFIERMLKVAAAVGLLPMLLSIGLMGLPPGKALACLAGSGVCCGVYFFSLARAYGLSDFTIVYPVARALPVVLVGFGDVMLGRELTGAGWAGLAIVAAGCILTPLESVRGFQIRRYFHVSMVWIMLAAIGTVGYSLLDNAASDVIRPGPVSAAQYGYVFFLLTTLVFVGLRRLSGGDDRGCRRVGWKLPSLAAACTCGSYWLVLWAYQLSSSAGYVVAFRQFSIIIGVAVVLHRSRECNVFVRIGGAVLITAGLAVVAIFGG